MRAEEVIVTHANTDFDAFAAMLAARRLYPHAVVCLAGSLNRNVREYYRLHADELAAVEPSRLELGAIERLVVVDTVHAGRLGVLEPIALDPRVEKVVFHHHEDDLPGWLPDTNAVVSRDGALTTTLVGILAERELAVTSLEATTFALGIHEDTGSLTYPTATLRDAEALAWCLRHGARQDLLATYLHTPLGELERELLGELLAATERIELGGTEILLAAVARPEYVEGISNLAHKIVDLTDCKALIVLVETGERVIAVLRSRTDEIDAARLAASLDGGGHAEAASAIFRGSLADARRLVLDALPRAAREPVRARDVMARPPRTVSPTASVASAMVVCQRHRQSGILVAEGERLVGAVGREDLDKAIAHGLSHAPVKGIMSSSVASCAEETPLAELQALLRRSDAGRLAVERAGRLVGVVTRSDLLRALGTDVADPSETEGSIARELERLEHLAPVFEAVAAVSEHVDGVYLVGGTVRDILLGEPSFDVDIAVEGDAIALARSLAGVLGGRVRPHEKFGTAVVLYSDGQRVDVVTARTEFYDAPGALPSVEHASIREDLFRRDFTINAMAVSLQGADFGRLVDPFGGRPDLEGRTIRVLHSLSFIDDPTRIFRAIRYENRHGFGMDEHTLLLARACIDLGLVGDLSSARLREEIVTLLDEREVAHSILRLAELGAARAIHPQLAADEEAVRLRDRMTELSGELSLERSGWRLGLIALARRLSSDAVLDWLLRLKLQRADAERIAEAVTVGPLLAERLRGGGTAAAEIVALVEPYGLETPLYALALSDSEALRRYFTDLRLVQLEIGGAELAELGVPESPRVGEILAELRRRKLNGELDGRASELAAARGLIAGQ